MLPPGDRKWQLIYPIFSDSSTKSYVRLAVIEGLMYHIKGITIHSRGSVNFRQKLLLMNKNVFF